jgi:hypothetical protein
MGFKWFEIGNEYNDKELMLSQEQIQSLMEVKFSVFDLFSAFPHQFRYASQCTQILLQHDLFSKDICEIICLYAFVL